MSDSLAAQDLRGPNYLSKAKQGFQQMYQLNYVQAKQTFSTLESVFPENPGPPLDLASVVWIQELFERSDLDLKRFIFPGYFTKPVDRKMPLVERQAFFDNVKESQSRSRAILQKDPGNKDARYFLGSAEGILAAFAFTVDHNRGAAFTHGKKAYQLHKKLMEEDPKYYDAYMSVGLYEYIIDNLPWYIKWIATIIGYRGSKERGFEYLGVSAQKGLLVAEDTRVLLMGLYVREGKYQLALEIARRLHQRYPENFLLHLNVGQILRMMKKETQAVETYLEVLRLAEERKPNYHKLNLGGFRYNLGQELMRLDRLDLALDQFEKSIRDPDTPALERSFSHLKAGQISDLLGRRDEAISHYEKVKLLKNFSDSHKKAGRYLKKPYRGR